MVLQVVFRGSHALEVIPRLWALRPSVAANDLSGAFIFVSPPQGSAPLAETFADAPAVRGKDHRPPPAPTVGCATLPPICFRILPTQSILVLNDQKQDPRECSD